MPKINQKTVAALALGIAWGSLGAWGMGAQAAPRAHRAVRHAAHRQTAHRRVPTPPDSYLQYKVYTVDQLIQQVSDNPQVRRRFARHFQLPANHVVDYMRANLVESYIPRTGRYTVYCVHHSGKFYPVRQTFRRGTKVFALRNGEPVMKWVCGNPLTKFASTVTDVVSNKPVAKPPMVAEYIPSDLENQVVPTEQAQVQVSPSLESLASPVSSAIGGKAPNLAYGFLPAIGLLGVNHGHHTTTHVVPVPEVPESSGLLYLTLGLPITLVAVRRRRALKNKA